MNAEIEGVEGGYVKLFVTDNQGAEHDFTVHKETGIEYHSSQKYEANPARRTREECEYVDQARRYARWYVYRERGYDTVPPRENPDRILAALLGIATLSDAAFEERFGELESRLRSHYDDSSVDLPFEDADPDDAIVYQQDLYLRPDPTEFDPPVLDQFRAHFGGQSDSPVGSDPGELELEALDSLSFDLEATSEVHVLHNDGRGNQQVHRGADPMDRDPDARIEIMAFDPSEVDPFQHYVVSHLAYQIRDRFLLMGVEPPDAFRAQGWGTYEGFQCQKFCSLYEEYWSSSATISSWAPR